MPAVSVIIPAQNRPTMLWESAQSVLAQSFHDLELIIVLKAAIPEVAVVANDLKHDPRVRVLAIDNCSLAAARNRGIEIALGEWIAFLDDDDLWKPTKLDAQIKTAISTASDFVATSFCAFNEAGQLPGAFQPQIPDGMTFPEAQTIYNFVPVGSSSILVKASAMRSIGMFDETFRACEDWDAWRRMAWKHKFQIVPEELVLYRKHSLNMSRKRGMMLRQEFKHLLKLTFDTPHALRHMIPRAWSFFLWRIMANGYEFANEMTSGALRTFYRAHCKATR